jgi:BirA family biotin operon repressor/biotin-[acetyl-CoA-carboxylase] ligase
VSAPAPLAWRLECHEELGSTSDHLLTRAAAGEAEGLAVRAQRQTAGRGRDGRVWRGEAGNLHISLLLRPGAPARQAPQWGLLAAVALHDALSPFAPARLTLKWPNDVMLGDAKLAGMLCESSVDAAGRIEWLVIGLGANLAHAPAVPGRATTCLPGRPAPEIVAARLLDRFDAWRQAFLAEGFAPIRAAWEARGPAPDTALVLRGGLAGGYRGLREDGSLLIAAGDRVHAVMSGEVD